MGPPHDHTEFVEGEFSSLLSSGSLLCGSACLASVVGFVPESFSPPLRIRHPQTPLSRKVSSEGELVTVSAHFLGPYTEGAMCGAHSKGSRLVL